MHRSLQLFPGSLCAAVSAIEVEIAFRSDWLALRYLIAGKIADVRLPHAASSERANNLWQHTCFEAFIGRTGSTEYCEFNFSPSSKWAAYSFMSYREGMRDLETAPPLIKTRATSGNFELSASIDLKDLALPLRMGLAAVIEETSGHKSYWALAHAAKPDFHCSDSFTLELPA